MPELPEVESVRRSLEPVMLEQLIQRAQLLRRDVLIAPGDPQGGFSRQRSMPKVGGSFSSRSPVPLETHDLLYACRVTEIRRRGKQLAIVATDPAGIQRALGVQLGMTGAMVCAQASSGNLEQPAHTHAQWSLGGQVLRFIDPRRFGGLRVFRSLLDLDAHFADLGPDALTIDADALKHGVSTAKRPIKAALLDQGIIAGVGNIYADESLFIAGIHPATLACRLQPPVIDTLARAIRDVLAQALAAGGSTIRDYRSSDGTPGSFQDRHLVYGRSGEPCVRCRTPLRSARLAQRATVWCPKCQTRAGKRAPS